MIDFAIGVAVVLSINAFFYYAFVDKEKTSFKDYLKAISRHFFKMVLLFIGIGCLMWIPMLLTAITT